MQDPQTTPSNHGLGLGRLTSSAHLIDTHVHLWDPSEGYPWLADQPLLRRRFAPEELYASVGDYQPRVSVVVVEAGRGDESEGAALLASADAHDIIAGAVVAADLRTGRGRVELTRLLSGRHSRYLLGLRQPLGDRRSDIAMICEHQNFLRDNELVVEVNVPWHRLNRAEELAARMPGVVLVLNHCGGPPPLEQTDDLRSWRQALLAVAAVPNVRVKLSGLLTQQSLPSPPALRELCHTAITAFGPIRVMVGSDWPICTTRGSWSDSVAAMLDACDGLHDDAFEQVSEGVARATYARSPAWT